MTKNILDFINYTISKIKAYLDYQISFEVLPYFNYDVLIFKYNTKDTLNLMIKIDHLNKTNKQAFINNLLMQINLYINENEIINEQDKILELVLFLNYLTDIKINQAKDFEIISTYLKRIKYM
ncbi:hypothetical protein J6P51_03625 [bacterium]|nr:hypothetical protein [bacterium]MBO6023045.1 hypothetical protein [bacterium]